MAEMLETVNPRRPYLLPVVAVLAGLGATVLFALLELKVAAAVAGAAVFLVLAVNRPVWGLALMASLLTIEGMFAGDLQMTEIRVAGIAAFAAWLAHMVIYGKRLRVNSAFVAILAFYVWAGISILWAGNPEEAGEAFATLTQLLLFYLLTINVIEGERELRIVMAALLLGAVATSPLAIKVFITNVIERARVFEAQDANGYSLVVGLGIFGGLYLTTHLKSGFLRVVSGILTFWLAFPLIPAQSRTCWVAVTVGLLIFLWYTKHRVRNILLLLLLIAGVVSASFAFGLVNVIFLKRTTSLVTMEDRGSNRLDIWLVGAEMFADNPLFGVGFRQFPEQYNRYRSQTPGVRRDEVPNRVPHNIYILAAAETGIIGLVLLLWIFWRTWREQWYPPGERPRFSLIFLAYAMTAGLAIPVFLSKFFWLALALSAKIQTLEAREEQGLPLSPEERE